MKNKSNDHASNTRIRLVYFEVLSILVFTIFVSYLMLLRIGAFGCGDECINYVAGHFVLNGKVLYREIFFNHQPGLAYLSAIIQNLSRPADLYHLVLYHRTAVSAFSLMFGILLMLRFRLSGLLFLLLYEGTKFYVYGYQFIGEAFIVYPLVYMVSLMWEVWRKKSLSRLDIYAATVCALIVVALREPYIPLAVILLMSAWWVGRNSGAVRPAIMVFVAGISVPFLWIPFQEYLYQVGVVNIPLAGDLARGVKSIVPILTSAFYPASVFVTGKTSYFRNLEIVLALFFWTGIAVWIRSRKNPAYVWYTFLILTLAGIRTVPPGSMYFDAFHMLPWYAVFITMTVNFMVSVDTEKARRILVGAFFLFAMWAVFSPASFIWEHSDRAREFESQYAKYTHYSDAIRILTDANDPIFLDMWDDIIYWESGRPSSYPLQLYIPIETGVQDYRNMRLSMFRTDPPVIYYSCPGMQTHLNSLPDFAESLYTQLLSLGRPGCLYIRNDRLSRITSAQWQKLHAIDIDRP